MTAVPSGWTPEQAKARLEAERAAWVADGVTCHFCGGPSFAWMTDDETWAKVAALLGQSQACFECFGAAWVILGHNDGEPFWVSAMTTPPFEAWGYQ